MQESHPFQLWLPPPFVTDFALGAAPGELPEDGEPAVPLPPLWLVPLRHRRRSLERVRGI